MYYRRCAKGKYFSKGEGEIIRRLKGDLTKELRVNGSGIEGDERG